MSLSFKISQNNNLLRFFQVGKKLRHLISLFFRLLYPWYWPSSCWNFIVCCIKAIFYTLLGYLLSGFGKFRKNKHA
uniref:Uncharacterized protein n=1 Tax=Kalanchoe fedtschenkoi TaxID=63787 RepID=A0A7N0VAR3_KALFE